MVDVSGLQVGDVFDITSDLEAQTAASGVVPGADLRPEALAPTAVTARPAAPVA